MACVAVSASHPVICYRVWTGWIMKVCCKVRYGSVVSSIYQCYVLISCPSSHQTLYTATYMHKTLAEQPPCEY